MMRAMLVLVGASLAAGSANAALPDAGQAASAAAAPAPAHAAADPNKVHCVRTVETGSLVRSTRECHTEAEWAAIRADARHSAQNMQNTTNSLRSNGP